jgi:HK97 family phage major capsid protein
MTFADLMNADLDQADDPAEVRRDDPKAAAGLEGRSGARAVQAWLRRTVLGESPFPTADDVSKRQVKALEKYGIKKGTREVVVRLRRPSAERRALAFDANTGGGYIAAEGFGDAVAQALTWFSPIRQLATIATTKKGTPMPWPFANDLQSAGTILLANQALTTQDVSFTQGVLGAYKYTSRLILVAVELLEDALPTFMEFLAKAIAQRISLAQNADFTAGIGTARPLGLVNAATVGAQAASSTGIAFDDLMNLIGSVDPVYRLPDMRPCFQMHPATLLALQKLKDGDGNYMLSASAELGRPLSIFGFPVVPNFSMSPTISSGVRSVTFGAMAQTVIRDVNEIRLRVLYERYADSDQVGVVGFLRSDFLLLDAGSHPVRCLQH